MNIQKFPQSCALIQSNNSKLLIDPGRVKFDKKYIEQWKTANAIFITHRHGDHCYCDIIKNLDIPIYSTREVANFYPELKVNIVKAGDVVDFGDIKVEVTNAVHGYILPGAEINENVGYIVDDGKIRIYFTSDTVRFKNNYKADVLFCDVTAFDASMNLWGASQTYRDVDAKLLIVAHQDEGRMFYTKEQIKSYLEEQNINFVIPELYEIIKF